MSIYTRDQKLEIIEKIKQLEEKFGTAPLKNVDLDTLNIEGLDVVGVGALVYTTYPKTILLRRKETPLEWAIPGGGVDAGENLIDSVKREVKEETGLEIDVDGLIRIGWAPNYSPPAFRESNKKRFGKESIGLLLVNLRGVVTGGKIDWSQDPSQNIIEVREFENIPFNDITYSYKVMFVQQGLWDAKVENFPVLGFKYQVQD